MGKDVTSDNKRIRERGCVNKICQNFNVLVRGGAGIGAGEVVSQE